MHAKDSRHPNRNHAGQVLVIFAVSLFALVGFAALAVDVGHLLAERRGVQNATDSAALAAARLALRDDTATLEQQARAFIANNGYPDANVTIQWPYDGDDTRVYVEVTQEVDRFFLGAFYDGDWAVTTSAIARLAPQDVPFALIVLGDDPHCVDPLGVRLSGAAMDFQLMGGGLATNACVHIDGNLFAAVDGTVQAQGTISDWAKNWDVNGGIMEEQGRVDDPYQDFAATNDPMDSEYCQENVYDADDEFEGNPVTLEPGYYTSTADLTFSANTRVVMESGVYCINTPFRLGPGAQSSLDGMAGVLIYLMNGGSFEPGNGNYELRTIGDEWNRIVLWSESCADLILVGTGNVTVDGVIYAPCSFVELGGNAGTRVVNGQVVAHSAWLHGNVTLSIDAGNEIEPETLRVFLIG